MPVGIYIRTKPPWNKGKILYPHSEDHNKKISLSLMGKKKTKIHSLRIGNAKRGIPLRERFSCSR